MTDTKKWESDIYEMVGEATVPFDDGVHTEATLFDFCMNGNEDDEGYLLSEKLIAYFKSLLLQTQQETLEWCEREVVGDYEQGYNNPNGKHRSGESAEQMVINMFKAEQHQTIKNKIKSLEEK